MAAVVGASVRNPGFEVTRDFRNPFAPEPETGWECALHGHVETEVCHACFAAQQLRVESESYDLRYANTAEAIRHRVLAAGNGHGRYPQGTYEGTEGL